MQFMRPTHMATITVATRLSMPWPPNRYRVTNTGEEVAVNAARILNAALNTECAMEEAVHRLPV